MARLKYALSLLLACSPAGAQLRQADRSLQLTVENDLITVRGAGPPPDYDYTHGTRMGVAWPGAPGWMRRLLGNVPECRRAVPSDKDCITSGVELGQEIYTPRRDAAVPVRGERPYAGWLYGATVARVASLTAVRSIRLALGVTGRPALAAEVQNGLHRLLRNDPQLGWAHQLAFRPGFAIAYEESFNRERSFGGSRAGRLELNWGTTVGNLRRAFHTGLDVRLGLRAPLPWVPGEPDIRTPMRLYILAGVRQEVVAHDLLIEGNGAKRRSLVPQYASGIGARGRHFTIEYRHVARGREYSSQPDMHAYGSLVFRLHEF